MENIQIKYQGSFKRAKKAGRKISMITAYDYTSACLVNKSGIDCILVGDSLGNVIQGHDSTLPVTMDEMIYHGKIVRRGAPGKFLVLDMPFGSYQGSEDDAVIHAGRFIKECGAQAVKLEGAGRFLPLISRLTESSVPVMGHLGLTPQSIHNFGSYRVQGKTDEDAERLVCDAVALERAGCFAIVLELVVSECAKRISENVSVPTIGIGSGIGCDGQVLVFHDLLGLNPDFKPKFVKTYTDGAQQFISAFNQYHKEITDGTFPGPEHSFFREKKSDNDYNSAKLY